MNTEKNTVSDKPEKALASSIIKTKHSEQFVSNGSSSKGISIKECPIIPIGNIIFLKWNIKESKIINSDNNKLIDPYFTIIGFGGMIKTFELGDKLYLKESSFKDILHCSTEDDSYKWHTIYEHSIMGILK
ncbi:MAG TPA: hypothetical protein VJN02_07985 [Gammaproteobacteria bacterium]|nr:hypothetical protein [Gammaproteobacteria bacterium]